MLPISGIFHKFLLLITTLIHIFLNYFNDDFIINEKNLVVLFNLFLGLDSNLIIFTLVFLCFLKIRLLIFFLIFIVFFSNSEYQLMQYNQYFLNDCGFNFNLNTKLLNSLFNIHPVLIYLYYFTLLIFLAKIFRFSIFFIKKKDIGLVALNIMYKPKVYLFIYSFLGLVLGSWWAAQEMTWGGWWGWDLVEFLNLLLLIIAVLCIHTSRLSAKYSYFNHILIIVLTLVILINRYGILNSIHAFISGDFINQYIIQLLLCFILSLFILLFYTLLMYSHKSTVKLNLFKKLLLTNIYFSTIVFFMCFYVFMEIVFLLFSVKSSYLSLFMFKLYIFVVLIFFYKDSINITKSSPLAYFEFSLLLILIKTLCKLKFFIHLLFYFFIVMNLIYFDSFNYLFLESNNSMCIVIAFYKDYFTNYFSIMTNIHYIYLLNKYMFLVSFNFFTELNSIFQSSLIDFVTVDNLFVKYNISLAHVYLDNYYKCVNILIIMSIFNIVIIYFLKINKQVYFFKTKFVFKF